MYRPVAGRFTGNAALPPPSLLRYARGGSADAPYPASVSFGLSRGRTLDPGPIAISEDSLPPLPDDILTRPQGGWVNAGSWFADPTRPLELEIGSGKGTFLLQQSTLQPGTNFLGIEYAREFFLYAADRLRRAGVPNVRMLCLDAGEFVHWRLADASVSVIHLYFADPWPKARHHRRRMVSDRFLGDAARVLKPGGELRIVTDHADYWAWMEDHFARWCGPGRPFERLAFTPPESVGEGELVGTNFERKYRVEGRPFNAAVLRKLS